MRRHHRGKGRHHREDLARKGRLWEEVFCRTGLAWVERLPRGKERQEDRTTLARMGRGEERQEVGWGEEREKGHRRELQEACPGKETQEADRRREGRVLQPPAFRRGLRSLVEPRPEHRQDLVRQEEGEGRLLGA